MTSLIGDNTVGMIGAKLGDRYEYSQQTNVDPNSCDDLSNITLREESLSRAGESTRDLPEITIKNRKLSKLLGNDEPPIQNMAPKSSIERHAGSLKLQSSSHLGPLCHTISKVAVVCAKIMWTMVLSGILLALTPIALLTEGATQLATAGKHGFFEKLSSTMLLPAAQLGTKHDLPLSREIYKNLIIKTDLKADDGTSLEAFHVRSEKYDLKQTRHLVVVYCPNRQDARSTQYMREVMDDLTHGANHRGDKPTDFLFVNYRGVGGSEGSVKTATDLVCDGRAGLDWAKSWAEKQKTDLSSVTLYGQSLGGGVASAVAREEPNVHVRLRHTFTNWTDAAVNMGNKFTGSYIGHLLQPLFNAMGGDKISPETLIKERILTQFATENPTAGTLWVEKAVNDGILGKTASVDIGLIDSSFDRQRMRMIHVEADHLQTGSIVYDSHEA